MRNFSRQRILNISHHLCVVLFISIVLPLKASSQDLLFEDDPEIKDAFRSTIFINAQTTLIPEKQGWQFFIRHRFGAVKVDKSIVKNFLGTDLVANIQFSFAFPLGDKTFIGAGRTKFGKEYDLHIKRIFLIQTTDNKIPFSVGAYLEASCMSDDFPPVPKYAYFGDGVTSFSYSFGHRISYNSQILLSRKFGQLLSLELNPVFIYRNLVPVGQDNHTFNITAALGFKTSKNSSILAEYAYRFNNQPENGYYPFSLAMEFGTVGHAFQIVVSSARDLQEQRIYSSETTDYPNGEFLFGFNLKRTFWYKKKKANDNSSLHN